MKIYVDMDGVLADWFTEVEKSHNVEHYSQVEITHVFSKIKGSNFFNNLPKLPNADLLVSTIVNLFGEYYILTTPFNGDEENTISHKKAWIKTNLLQQPKEVIFSARKYEYAQGNVLIDDYRPNISAWESHGGIGIKYKALSKNYTIDDIIKKLNGLALNTKICK